MKKLFIYTLTFVTLLLPTLSFALGITTKGQLTDVKSVNTPYNLSFAYDEGKLEYYGMADPDTDKDAPGWQIQKLIYNDNGNLIGIKSADGQIDFDKIWDDREFYQYE